MFRTRKRPPPVAAPTSLVVDHRQYRVPLTVFCLGPLSNWYPSPFELDGRRFPTLEHYMMWRKAKLFADSESARRIIDAGTPADAKLIGREVRGFDEMKWYRKAKSIVYHGARRGKFAQHEESRVALLETKGTIIVEASSSDTIWGVGLGEIDRFVHEQSHWRGTNWLGEVLTFVREDILAEADAI